MQTRPASCPFIVPSQKNYSNWGAPTCRPPSCPTATPCQTSPGCSEEECPPTHSPACTSSHQHCVQDQIQECSSRYKTIAARACRCQRYLVSNRLICLLVKKLIFIPTRFFIIMIKTLIREGVFAPPWCNTSKSHLGGCALLLAAHFSRIKINNNDYLSLIRGL